MTLRIYHKPIRYAGTRTAMTLWLSLTATILMGSFAQAANPSLAKTLEIASHRSEFESPTDVQLATFYHLASDTLAAHQPPTVLRDRWQTIGWTLTETSINESRVWIIHDRAQPRRGSGVFVIRPDSTNRVALQCPHSFYDRFTRPITIRLFERSNVRAAAWNSVHRKVCDVAHEGRSYFHEFTRAFIATQRATDTDAFIVQIHGFSQAARKTKNGASADIIVSNGTRFPPQWLRATAIDLLTLSPNVRLFPTQVSELGATTNSQALLSQKHGTSFLHVELSDPLRRKLRRQNAAIDQLSASILAAGRDQ